MFLMCFIFFALNSCGPWDIHIWLYKCGFIEHSNVIQYRQKINRYMRLYSQRTSCYFLLSLKSCEMIFMNRFRYSKSELGLESNLTLNLFDTIFKLNLLVIWVLNCLKFYLGHLFPLVIKKVSEMRTISSSSGLFWKKLFVRSL